MPRHPPCSRELRGRVYVYYDGKQMLRLYLRMNKSETEQEEIDLVALPGFTASLRPILARFQSEMLKQFSDEGLYVVELPKDMKLPNTAVRLTPRLIQNVRKVDSYELKRLRMRLATLGTKEYREVKVLGRDLGLLDLLKLMEQSFFIYMKPIDALELLRLIIKPLREAIYENENYPLLFISYVSRTSWRLKMVDLEFIDDIPLQPIYYNKCLVLHWKFKRLEKFKPVYMTISKRRCKYVDDSDMCVWTDIRTDLVPASKWFLLDKPFPHVIDDIWHFIFIADSGSISEIEMSTIGYGNKRIGLLSPPYPSKTTGTPISWIYPHISYLRDRDGVKLVRHPTVPLIQKTGVPFLFNSLPIVHYVEKHEEKHPVERYRVIEIVDSIKAEDLVKAFFSIRERGSGRLELKRIPIAVIRPMARMEIEELLLEVLHHDMGLVLGHPVLVISHDAVHCYFTPIGAVLTALLSEPIGSAPNPLGAIFIENFYVHIPVIEISSQDFIKLITHIGNSDQASAMLMMLSSKISW